MPSIETYQLVLAAVAASEDKKAEDIRILALDPTESGLSDYFIICNGTNSRQNVAITDEIELRLKREFGIYPQSVEGRRDGEWVLMDYVDFIVHVFSPEKREYYGLERLRKSATTISVGELNGELKQRIAEARSRAKNEVLQTEAAAQNPSTARKAKSVTAQPKQTTEAAAKEVVRKARTAERSSGEEKLPATKRKTAALKISKSAAKVGRVKKS